MIKVKCSCGCDLNNSSIGKRNNFKHSKQLFEITKQSNGSRVSRSRRVRFDTCNSIKKKTLGFHLICKVSSKDIYIYLYFFTSICQSFSPHSELLTKLCKVLRL